VQRVVVAKAVILESVVIAVVVTDVVVSLLTAVQSKSILLILIFPSATMLEAYLNHIFIFLDTLHKETPVSLFHCMKKEIRYFRYKNI